MRLEKLDTIVERRTTPAIGTFKIAKLDAEVEIYATLLCSSVSALSINMS